MIVRAIILQMLLLGALGASFGQSAGDTLRDILRDYHLNIVPITAFSSKVPAPVGSATWTPDSLHINATPASNPGQILDGHPAVSLRQYQPGGLATLSLRGTGSGHLQNFWNGIPVNSSMLGQSDLGLGMATVLGKPGLILGGGSLVQGSGGLGGVVDWRVFEGTEPTGNGLNLFSEGGSFGSYRGAASFAAGTVNQVRTAVSFARSDNDFPFFNTGQAGHPEQRMQHAGFRQFAASTSFRHFFFGGQQVILHAYGHHSDRELPPTMITTDADESQSDKGLRAVLEHRAPLLKYFSLHSSIGAVADRLQYENKQAGIDALSSTLRTQARMELRHAYKRNPWLHFESAGFRLMRDWAWAEAIPPGLSSDLLTAHVLFEGEAFKQQVKVWRWSGLVRQEWLDWQWSTPLFFAGLERISPSGRSKYHLNASRNRRWPTLNDRFWTPGGNPELKPEQSLGGELGGTWVLRRADSQIEKTSTWTATSGLTVFSQMVRDWILWLPGSGSIWSPVNESEVWTKGMEADLRLQGQIGRIGWSLNPTASYTLSSVLGDSSGIKQLIYTPKEIVKVRAEADWRGWTVNVNWNYTGTRYTTRDNTESLPGFATLDMVLGKQISLERHRLDCGLGAYNLANKAYQVVAWRPMPGRSFFVRLNWTWQ